MTIKTQQRALLAVIGVIFLILLGIVYQANHTNQAFQSRGILLSEVVKQVFDFNVVANDYNSNHHDRALAQMETRINSLAAPLGSLQFRTVERIAVRDEMLKELDRARHVFEQLKKRHLAFKSDFGKEINEKSDSFAHQEIADLSANLSISSMALVTSSQYLMKTSAEQQAREAKFYERLIFQGILISFALLVTAVFIFSRRFVTAVENLKTGAELIASGNLITRIEVTGSDELTDLTRTINTMSETLQSSYEALGDEIEERKRAEETLLESEQQLRRNEESINSLNKTLENQLQKLKEANREMESFTYSVSHDLRAPLRHITGFVEMLERRDTSGLDDKSRHYLNVISESAKKMGCLIDDLLSFSRMGRGEMMKSRVDLNLLVKDVVEEIVRDTPPARIIEWQIGELPTVIGDQAMLRLVLVNLLANAVKYSSHVEKALIGVEISSSGDDFYTVSIRDNGAGFDMKYVDKLFGLFQRLHSSEEYEGTGVGLANVRRIISRHGGRTWAEGELDKGAAFYFTLPKKREEIV